MNGIMSSNTMTKANMTSAERFAESARLFLEQERRVLAVEAAQAKLEQKRENHERKLQQIETATDHLTVIVWYRYAKQAGSLPLPQAAAMGRVATQFCREHEIETGKVPDPRFGEVKTYPKWVLDELFTGAVN